jgi:CRP-like cAMP-binding protein
MAFVNQLLSAAADDVQALIRAQMTSVSLPFRSVLVEAGSPMDHIYFLEDGLISLVSEYEQGRLIEVGMIGREGFFDPGLLLHEEVSVFKGTVQAEGSAFAVPIDLFHQLVDTNADFRLLMMKFARSFELQIASTVSANGRAKLEERLARWLLMVHDRVDSLLLHITHDFLAQMLCTRRPGVTIALHLLEGKGLITSTRGLIEIRSREGLIEEAGGAYGKAEEHYVRLFGRDFRPQQ